jgi:hypothetical protein
MLGKNQMNLDLENLAPISISVYNRLDHFRNCIKSLLANDLARHSVLYIFSDGAKSGDEESVSKVRNYAKLINGFKKVNLISNKKNNLNKIVRDLHQIPFEVNGKNIHLEDDVVVSKHFLRYMNEGLNKFEFHPDVYSVSGYLYPINHNIKSEYFFLNRFIGWGVGFWEKKTIKMLKNSSSKKLILNYVNNWKDYKELNSIAPNMINSLPLLLEGKWKRSDYRFNLYYIKNKKYTLVPKKSLTKNIGHDGSGLNCSVKNNYNFQKIYHDKININKNEIVKTNLSAQKKIAKSLRVPRKHGSYLYFYYIKLKCKFPKFIKFLKSNLKL